MYLNANIVLLAVVIVLSIIAFYKGKSVLFSIIVSFYPAAIIYKAFPYTEKFIFFKDGGQQIFLSHVILFLIVFIPILFASMRIVHGGENRYGFWGIIDSVLLSLSVVALTIVLTSHVIPAKDIYSLSSATEDFFRSDLGYFLSVLCPVGVVYWLSRH